MCRERTQMSLTLNYLKKNQIIREFECMYHVDGTAFRGPNIIRFPKHLPVDKCRCKKIEKEIGAS